MPIHTETDRNRTPKQTETDLIKNLNKKTAETENINRQDVECIDESSRTQE